jgi:RimJ/RimL family protein N-acetyltransferase
MGDAAFTALTTQRLVLRRFRPEDLDAFVAYRSDPETARYQNWEVPYRPSQARQFLQELEAIHPDTPGEWFQFAVALRHTDRLIGDCGAHAHAEDPRQAEIGFTLAPQHQGYGYATEAVRRLLHYLLIERGKHRVRATCDDRNTRSAAVLERVGMRREGHLLESTWSKGLVDQRPALWRPASRMAQRLLTVGSASHKRPARCVAVPSRQPRA